jgi:DNA-binding IclR family transcriptional regulator
MSERGSTGSRTLSRGLSVLQRLADSPEGATVAQLATATDLDRAVLYRLLQTLVDEGFVVRDPDTRKFHLGATMIELGIRATRALRVRRLALPGMRALMEQAREAVCMAIRDRGDAVVVDRVEPRGLSVRVGYHVGTRHSLQVGAHGHALLAFLDDTERAASGTLAPPLQAELDSVRGRGFATSVDELERGAAGVAAPVMGPTGRPIASIGVVAPSLRLRDPAVLGPRVRALTLEISRRLNQPANGR